MQQRRGVRLVRSSPRLPASSARRPSRFFKIILPSIINDHKLRIPQKFVKKFGRELSSIAKLTVPNGRLWSVRLEKADNNLWFHSGWQEFVEHYSIRVGYFLVFRYEGNSNFHVLIFNLTASEISYPINIISISDDSNHGKKCSVTHKEVNDVDDSVEFLGSIPPSQMHLRNKFLHECVDQPELGRSCNPPLQEKLVESSVKIGLGVNDYGSSALVESSKSKHCDLMIRKKPKMEDQEAIIVLDELNEPSQAKLSKKKLSKSHESLSDKTKEDNQHEAKPAVNLQLVPISSAQHMGHYFYGSEHKDFIDSDSEENQHQPMGVDDMQPLDRSSQDMVLQFDGSKLIKTAGEANIKSECEHESLLKDDEDVKILGTRTCSTTFWTRRPVTVQEREKTIHAAKLFKPQNPSFIIILQLYNSVPASFAQEHLSWVSEDIKLQGSDGRQWPVRCIRGKGLVGRLSKGWVAFVRDNHLEEGDVCVFELIKKDDVVLQVHIFRIAEVQTSEPNF